MANYSLVIGSKFSPFTYEELLKAPVMATQAYQEIEAGLSDLAAEANVWEEIANEQTDPYAYSLYKKYADDLSAQAELLASKGLTPESRSALSKMKSRYSSEITPIKNAYTRRQALATEQREARNKDATMLFDRDIATMSLDDFIRNPEITYSPYSGALIASQVGTAAKSLAKAMRDNPRKWKSILENQYYETIMQKGYTPEEVLLATLNDPKAPQDLRNIVEDVIDSTGIREWKNPNALKQAYDYARQGLWESIGETTYQIQQNRGWINPNEKPKDGNKLTPSPNFSPRIMEGVVGKEEKSLKLLDGLRPTPTGYSTNKLDSLRKNLENAKGELAAYSENDISKYESHRQKMDIATATPSTGVGSYQSLAQGISASTSTPSGYAEYSRKKSKYDNALKEYNDAVAEVNTIVEKYSHLGATPYEQLYIGSRLDAIQQSQEKTSFALNLKESDYNNVRHGIANLVGAVDKETINRGAVGFIDSKGKSLNYKDTQEIIDNIDNVKVKVSGGANPKLKVVYGGKEYSIKGVEQLDKYNRELKIVNDYLKDFSSNITPSITFIDDKTYNDIAINGIMNVRLSNVNLQPIPGSNFEGTVLYSPTSGEYIKVLLDSEGNLIGTNTLSDELSGGQLRDMYFINMANAGLSGLTSLLARED